jgi:hypothetical protein
METELKLSKHEQFVQDLRALVAWVEEHPELGTPFLERLDYWPKVEDVGTFARSFGSAEKSVDLVDYFILRKRFGNIRLEATWYRSQVCERVIVGQEEVLEDMVITPAVTEKRKVLKDKVEWHCPQSILAPKD